MFNVGTPEVLVILLVALIVLGPDKLPAAARKVGHLTGDLRRMSAGFQDDLRGAMQEPLTDAASHRETTTIEAASPTTDDHTGLPQSGAPTAEGEGTDAAPGSEPSVGRPGVARS